MSNISAHVQMKHPVTINRHVATPINGKPLAIRVVCLHSVDRRIAVVYEDWRVAGYHMVRVDVADGEVVDGGVWDGPAV
ncbi:hypothetical protein, partial [Micromonospora sp. LOL_015]|uniref:hypothetical protein n=1 Tax=Micromonospora sp. LOL_015 TaxID=3345416 RepID=UPI003A8A0C8A